MTEAAGAWPEIESPCIGLCTLDESGVCMGCFRTGAEIAGWIGLTHDQRRAIMQALPARAQRCFDE